MVRWMLVVGARPQFMKAAALCRAAARYADRLTLDLIHTGQHYDHDMSQSFFDEMEIPAPAANLNVGSGPHGAMTGRILAGLEAEMMARKPERVLVVGDTNSTLAGALAAVKLHIPVAHIEAGLRSFNRAMPEEINRLLTDHISDFLFCPSELSRTYLAAEGITRGVHVTGDIMFDALLHYRRRAIDPGIDGPFAVATLHRPENVDEPARLASLIDAMRDAPVPVVLPLHPRTRARIAELGLPLGDNIRTCPPLTYFQMIGHLERCAFVMTDSGSLQKEAYYLGRKCLTLRDETEWTELVEIGANKILGADAAAIRAAYPWAMAPLTTTEHPYGEGRCAERVFEMLLGTPPAR